MQRERLTVARIKAFTCPGDAKQAFMWDSEMPRLAIRATAGAKSFIFECKFNRKTIRRTIGNVLAWDIDGARAEARRLQTMIDQGTDPREFDRMESQKVARLEDEANALNVARQRQETTLGEAWQVYIEVRRPKWGARHFQDHVDLAQAGGVAVRRGAGNTKPGPLAELMPLRLTDMTQERITNWADRESKIRPARVALARRLLIGFASWCRERTEFRELLPVSVFSSKAVREAIPRPKSKDDCLQREQLASWFAAVRRESPVISAYLQTLFLTGARREEWAGVRWGDIDFKWLSVTIKDKVDGERVIPLTPFVAKELAQLPRINEWVFSSPSAAQGRLVEPRIAHNRALRVAGLPPLTVHGLRRSFGTLAEWVECPAGITAQIMGHKPSAIAEKHYRRRPLDLLRMWHSKIEKWILDQAQLTAPEDVRPVLPEVRGGGSPV